LYAAGTNIGIDILVAKFFSKSNFLVKLVLPAILKNVSSHLLPDAPPSLRKPRFKKTVVERTVVRETKPALNNVPL
jgi:hypothetical protein